MIKLKSLIKEVGILGILGKHWWMDPRGRLTRVMKLGPDMGHHEVAVELLKAMGRPIEKDIFAQMYNLGWLRVSIVGNESIYTLEFYTRMDKQPNAVQFDALKYLAEEEKVHVLKNGVTRQTYLFGKF